MKKLILLFILGFNALIYSQSTSFTWAKRFDGPGHERCYSIVTDFSGNVITSGIFINQVDFDPGPSVYSISPVAKDIFISKLDAAGNFVWAKSIGGPSAACDIYDIKTDASGNIYLCGFFDKTVDFDPGPAMYTIMSVGNTDVFILKLDPSGNFIWAKRVGGPNYEFAWSMALDASANIHVTGSFVGTVDFDPGPGFFTLTSSPNTDIFVLKVDSAGNFKWAGGMGGTGVQEGKCIAVDTVGNVYTSGNFINTVDFDPGPGNFTLTAVNVDAFISKLDSAGNFVWAKSFEGLASIGYINGLGIIADAAGNSYITGNYVGTVDFDPGPGVDTVTTWGAADAFIVKLDTGGNLKWAKTIGGPGTQYGTAIALDASNNVFTTGYFSFPTDFDPGPGIYTLTAVGTPSNNDAYILKQDNAGNFLWVNSFGGPNGDESYDICVDASANVHTTGIFVGSVDFDPGPGSFVMNSNSVSVDVFVHKLGQSSVGIKKTEIKNNDVLIYPNPNNGSFNFNLAEESCKFILINSLGQKIHTQKTTKGENKINLNDLAPGIYLTIVNGENFNISQKIIIE
jgi:hypothetical protein